MKTYFPKLDSIRFYAFLIVFISHSYFNSPSLNSDKNMRLFAHGEIGVQIFFMLSGFLILYLAIKQFQKTNDFSIIHFFKKRILRIWPLYFLLIAISYVIYFIQGSQGSLKCANMFVYFFGNVCMLNGLPSSTSSAIILPLWSVSIEEQFYVVFPILFFLFIYLYKKYKNSATVITAVALLATIAVYSIYARYTHADNWSYIAYSSVSALPALLSGMLLAVLITTKENLFAKLVKYKKTLMIIGLCIFYYSFRLKLSGIMGVAMYVIPICVATTIAIIFSLYTDGENKLSKHTQYLGRISYGLYVYHIGVMIFINYLFVALGANQTSLIIIYLKIASSFALTVMIAHLSYQHIEKWFLKFK